MSDSRISIVDFDEDKKIKTYRTLFSFVFLLNDFSFHLLLINNMFHRVMLDSDVYNKFTKFGIDVYAILSNAKNVMEKFFRELVTCLESQNDPISVKELVTIAFDNLIRMGTPTRVKLDQSQNMSHIGFIFLIFWL